MAVLVLVCLLPLLLLLLLLVLMSCALPTDIDDFVAELERAGQDDGSI